MQTTALFLILACGDKTTDTATETTETTDDTSTETTDTATETDTSTTDTDAGETGDTNQDTDNTGDSTPSVGSWTVEGPEFTTNTCGGGESFPNPRTMSLGLSGTTLTMLIEEPNERSYAFTCTLTDTEFACDNITIENDIPMLPCTLTYTHTLQGVFTDGQTLAGDYTIYTASSGGSGCSEINLGFTTPCEQSGTMSATFNQ